MSAATLFRQRSVLTVLGHQCLITTYWADTAVVGGTALATEACARVRAFFNALASTIATGSTLAIDTSVVQLGIQDGQPFQAFTGSAPASVTFTGAGDPLPASTQALLRYQTGVYVRGRKLVGRTFLPGLTEGASGNGIGPLSGTVTTLNTALGLLGTTVTSTIDQVVWSRPVSSIPLSGQAEAVTSRAAATTWAVQRNRRP